jgi:chemotaxis response regulator CheB
MRNILLRGTIKVLIVDDSATIRAMLARLFEQELDFEVVGVAASADEADDILDLEDPDIITLDHEMPGRSGLDYLATLMDERPQRVIMLSSHAADPSFIEAAKTLGAKGCFDKSGAVRDSAHFIEMLRRVARPKTRPTRLSADIRALRDYGLLPGRHIAYS